MSSSTEFVRLLIVIGVLCIAVALLIALSGPVLRSWEALPVAVRRRLAEVKWSSSVSFGLIGTGLLCAAQYSGPHDDTWRTLCALAIGASVPFSLFTLNKMTRARRD